MAILLAWLKRESVRSQQKPVCKFHQKNILRPLFKHVIEQAPHQWRFEVAEGIRGAAR